VKSAIDQSRFLDHVFPMKSIMVAACCLFAPSGFSEEIYNLTKDARWSYDYHNIMTYSGGVHSMTNLTDGNMHVRVISDMITNGMTYAVLETTYENIFGVPPQKGFIRQDESGVYIGMEVAGEFRESPIVLLPAEVGNEWDYFDGEKGRRRIVEVGPMQIGDQTFDHCIKIERSFGDPEKDALWTHTSYYVPGLGEVRMYMRRVMGPTLTETTTTISTR